MERLNYVQEGRLRARVVRVARARAHHNCNCNPLHCIYFEERTIPPHSIFLSDHRIPGKSYTRVPSEGGGGGCTVAAATRTDRPNEADGSCDKAVCLVLGKGWEKEKSRAHNYHLSPSAQRKCSFAWRMHGGKGAAFW